MDSIYIETAVIALLVAICVFYVGRQLWRRYNKKGGCGGGCSCGGKEIAARAQQQAKHRQRNNA